ncbi:MAG TPA: polysaccharide deacetylase family protein, partial [Edaphobacter sp.]
TLGAPVRYLRPPHGARRPYVLRSARELNLISVQWNIIAGDWKPIDAATIATRVTAGINRNQRRNRASNIVLHDGGSLSLNAPRTPTVGATNQLLEGFKNTAAKFVTIESWAPAEPSHPEAHT